MVGLPGARMSGLMARGRGEPNGGGAGEGSRSADLSTFSPFSRSCRRVVEARVAVSERVARRLPALENDLKQSFAMFP